MPGPSSRSWRPSTSASALASRSSPPATLAFATRGPSRYFGGDEALAALAAELSIGVLGDRAAPRIGIADGPFAALLAAPAATVVVPPLGSPAFLAPPPRRHARSWWASTKTWSTCCGGSVCAPWGRWLPFPPATSPDGSVPTAWLPTGLAAGLDERPPAAASPPPDLAVRVELDPPAERVETAAFVARGLADELAGRLDAGGLACTRLLVAAETEHGERLERLWRGDGAGGAAALTAGAIADRVRWQLDGWLRDPAPRPTSASPCSSWCPTRW